jgi:hypothetical protein
MQELHADVLLLVVAGTLPDAYAAWSLFNHLDADNNQLNGRQSQGLGKGCKPYACTFSIPLAVHATGQLSPHPPSSYGGLHKGDMCLMRLQTHQLTCPGGRDKAVWLPT